RPAALSVGTPGTGYVVGDTVADAFGNTLRATVNTVDGSGGVLTFTITAPWSTFDVGPGTSIDTINVAPQSGAGTGFAFQVDSVNPTDGDVTLTLWYQLAGPSA